MTLESRLRSELSDSCMRCMPQEARTRRARAGKEKERVWEHGASLPSLAPTCEGSAGVPAHATGHAESHGKSDVDWEVWSDIVETRKPRYFFVRLSCSIGEARVGSCSGK